MLNSYPTLQQVNEADRYDICKWYRHLKSPENEIQIEIMNRICERFKEVGGFTPEISKHIGWN